MMKKNPLMPIHFLGSAICMAIIVGAFVFAGQSIQKRRGIFLNARQELATVQELQHQSTNERSQLAMMVQESIARSAGFITLDPLSTMNRRMVNIVEIAESSGIQVDALQHQDQLSVAEVQVQPFVLVGSANANAAYQFIKELANAMADVHVQRIDLSGVSNENSTVRVEVMMYWFVEPDGGN